MLKLFLPMAWRNIWYAPRKSLLAILAVATCYFSLNLFQGYIHGAEAIFNDSYEKRNMLGDLILRRHGTQHFLVMDEKDLLTREDQENITQFLDSDPEVELWMRFLRVNGTLGNGEAQTGFTGFGYDVQRGEQMRAPEWTWNAIAGYPLKDEGHILLGQRLGVLLGCEAAATKRFITGKGGYDPAYRPYSCKNPKLQVAGITLNGQANATELEVTGLIDAMFRELDLRFAYLPLSAAQKLFDTDKVNFFALKVKPGVNPDAVARRLNEKFSGSGLKAVSWKNDELGEFYRRTMDFLNLFRNFMVLVILGVALLSIFNTFFRNVQERVREIGVLRTLGFFHREVKVLFLLETLFLGLIGNFLGGALAILVSLFVNRVSLLYKIGLLTQPVPFLVYLSGFTFLWTFIVVICIALLAAWIPLKRAEKKSIVDSLTHN
jgi:putative ABC transport system permease protein